MDLSDGSSPGHLDEGLDTTVALANALLLSSLVDSTSRPAGAQASRATGSPFRASYDAERGLLCVSGTLDEAGTVALRAVIRRRSEDHSRELVVDLSAVDLLSSSAVGVLHAARSRSAGRLRLVAEPGCTAQRVLAVCGLPHLLALPTGPLTHGQPSNS